jgi:hypothetical protein
MNESPLENILRSDAVEVSADNPRAASVLFEDLSAVERRTNAEVILKNFLQRFLLSRNRKTHRHAAKNYAKRQSSFMCFLCLFVAILWPLRA